MLTRTRRWLGATAVALATLTAAACDGTDGALGPISPIPGHSRAPVFDGCPTITVPAGQQLAHRLYARGTQIYRWDGLAWTLVGPSATLYANAGMTAAVGTHYVGPTWQSSSGSKVVGAAQQRCTPDAGSVAWLLLGATSSSGPGFFEGTTYIQRVHTAGGVAPATPGAAIGDLVQVPYTTQYLFYKRAR